MKEGIITLSHGSGGRKMNEFIRAFIARYFSNPVINRMEDAAVVDSPENKLVLTTDSFVVSPLFFQGGDIGRLSVCGTINDLAAMGARPLYITAGLILEEGLRFSELERILSSMSRTCREAGVILAAGDTKVVERGKADKVFINTSGAGELIRPGLKISCSGARPGDIVIISGTLGDHEIAILKERKGLGFSSGIKSDCAPLNKMTGPLIRAGLGIRVMRDPTRGGLAAVLNEIAASSSVNITVEGDKIPVSKPVRSACALLGFDPLHLANEGKMAIICAKKDAQKAVAMLRKSKYGKNASIIGCVGAKSRKPFVSEITVAGGSRLLMMPEGEMLPRIC